MYNMVIIKNNNPIKEKQMNSIDDANVSFSAKQNNPTDTVKVPKKTKQPRFIIFILILAVAILGYLYMRQHKEIARLTDPVAQSEYAQKQVDKVITEMKQYVVIPADDELRLLGMVNDAESLKKDQVFYANVEKGDYVFLLTKSARALIWRPEDHKIVNFGIADTQQAQVPQKTQPTASSSVEKPAPAKTPVKEEPKTDKNTTN